MKRALIISLSLILLDQFLKLFFQFNFAQKELLLLSKWGFTFVINPGITIHYGINSLQMFAVQLLEVAALFILYFGFKNIFRKVNKSLLLEFAFGFFTTALLGNVLIDRVIFGGIRDYFITPIGVANFADMCGILGIILISLDLIISRRNYKNLILKKI